MCSLSSWSRETKSPKWNCYTLYLSNKIFIAFVAMWNKYRYGRSSVTATATLMMLRPNKCSFSFWRADWHKVAIMKLLHSIYLSNKIFITFEVPSQRQSNTDKVEVPHSDGNVSDVASKPVLFGFTSLGNLRNFCCCFFFFFFCFFFKYIFFGGP